MTNITLRSVKGSPLTNNEVDSNFSSLNDYKVEQTDSTGSALIPSGTTAQRDASPSAGMFRYNSDLGQFEGYTTDWGEIGGSVDSAIIQGIVDSDWTGRGLNDLNDVSISNGDVKIRTNNGDDAFYALFNAGQGATGSHNIAIGQLAYRNEGGATGVGNIHLGANSGQTNTGNYNVGVGYQSSFSMGSGENNVHIGRLAGNTTTTGSNTIVIGYDAEADSAGASNEITLGNLSITSFRIPGLQSTATHGQVLAFDSNGGDIAFTTVAADTDSAAVQAMIDSDWTGRGINDLSDGYSAGNSIGFGSGALANDDGTTNYNVAIGYQTGTDITSGADNVLVGRQSGFSLETGSNNIAIGPSAMTGAVTGGNNIAIGPSAMNGALSNTSGYNIGIGHSAGRKITSGTEHVFIGRDAGQNVTGGQRNVVIGTSAASNMTGGEGTTVIGYGAQASSATVSNEITLGNTSVTSFRIPGLQSTATHGQVLAFDSNGGDIAFTTIAAGLDSADLTNGTFTGKVIFDSAQVNGIEFKSPSTTHTMTLDLGNDDVLRLTNGTTDLITIQDAGTIFSVQNGGTEYFNVDASGFIAFVNHAIGSQTLTTTSTSQTAIATFAHASYIGAEVVITAKDGTASHITRLNVVHDGTTASATEYGSVFTGSALSTYDVDISGADLRILATPASTNSTVFRVALTLMDA